MNYCEGENPEKGQTFDLPESIKKTVKNRMCVLINKIKLIKLIHACPARGGVILSKE
jgi:hypothetical protein